MNKDKDKTENKEKIQEKPKSTKKSSGILPSMIY